MLLLLNNKRLINKNFYQAFMNKKILVVENKRWYRLEAAAQLEDAFPEHDIQTARGRTEVDELIDVGSIPLDEIAIVCTGDLLDAGSTGWGVVERLRNRGYEGPALYIGVEFEIPERHRYLFSGKASYVRNNDLVEKVNQYLETQVQ
jgi:hypothetical protein